MRQVGDASSRQWWHYPPDVCFPDQNGDAGMKPTTQTGVRASAPSMKRRFAALLMSALIWAFGAAACGVQEGQEKIEKARQVEKQMEDRHQDLEQKLREGGQNAQEGR